MESSILSTEEEKIATRLADGEAPEEIADELGRDPEVVEKATDRIRAKTDRALATLLESPFAAEAVAELSDDELDALRAALDRTSSKRS